jgi:hypothetical protein
LNSTALDEFTLWVKKVQWNFFCTFTFAWRVSDAQAEKVFDAFVDRLERHLHCGICFIRGDEKRFSGCGMPASGRHFHVLMTCVPTVSPKLIESVWLNMAGTRADGAGAQVEDYNPNDNGAGYVLKHIYEPEGNLAFRNLDLYHPDAKHSQKQNKRWRRRLKRFEARYEKFA